MVMPEDRKQKYGEMMDIITEILLGRDEEEERPEGVRKTGAYRKKVQARRRKPSDTFFPNSEYSMDQSTKFLWDDVYD